MVSFQTFDLDLRLSTALEAKGITVPTPVQDKSIPIFLQRKNLIALASTGSGKTLAFLIPLLHMLLQGSRRARLPRSLILVPTRELAYQVMKNFEMLTTETDLEACLVIGGEGFSSQEKKLKLGVDVIIATPGRLLDLWDQGKLLLSGVRHFILDEADRMTDMGFYPDLRRIISLLELPLQYCLFSATMPAPVTELINSFVARSESIKVNNPKKTADTIKQFLAKINIPDRRWLRDHDYTGFVKRELLRYLLRQENPESAIVFCNRKSDVNKLERSLERYGFSCAALHGDMEQDQRFESLGRFTAGKVKILIASDVAARGLDIPDVSHVFNFDIPLAQDDYIHRIGRTGRAGKSGKAFTLSYSDKECEKLSQHVRETIESVDLKEFDLPEPRKANASKGDKKNSKKDRNPVSPRGSEERDIHDRRQNQEPQGVSSGFGGSLPAFMLEPVAI